MHKSTFSFSLFFFWSLNSLKLQKSVRRPPASSSLWYLFFIFLFHFVVNVFTHFYAQNSRSSVCIMPSPCMNLSLLFPCAMSFRHAKFLRRLRFVWEFDNNSVGNRSNSGHSVSSHFLSFSLDPPFVPSSGLCSVHITHMIRAFNIENEWLVWLSSFYVVLLATLSLQFVSQNINRYRKWLFSNAVCIYAPFSMRFPKRFGTEHDGERETNVSLLPSWTSPFGSRMHTYM